MKKIISTLIAVAMILTTMGTVAFADTNAVYPTATVTELNDPNYTFSVSFSGDAQDATYNGWYMNMELTSNMNVTLDVNSSTPDGHLAVMLPIYSPAWVNFPSRYGSAIELEPGVSFKVMDYYWADAYGFNGSQKYGDLFTTQKDLGCGVWLHPTFIESNPGLELTVALKLYNPNAGSDETITLASYTYEASEAVAKIGDKEYFTLSEAIEATKTMSGDVEILIAEGTYREDLTIVQQEGLNLTLKADSKTKAAGNVVLEGSITVDGAARQQGAETLTIDGLKFDSTYTDEEICFINSKITVPETVRKYSYAHNLTIKNCEFIDDNNMSKAFNSTQHGGDCNVTIENCTGKGLHSVAQVKNVVGEGLVITGCTFTEMKNGVNLNSSALTMSNTKLEVKGYAVRVGQPDSGVLSQIVTITESELKSSVDEAGDAPVVIRNGAENATVTLTGNIIEGNGVDILNSITIDNPSLTVNANKNYWGGSTPAVDGMTLTVENYYIDKAKTVLYNISTGLADTTNVSATAAITFSEEPVEEGDDYLVYDMFVTATEDGKTIANLVSAEADITVTPPAGRSIGLEVIGGDYNVSTSESGKYLFNLKNGLETNVVARSGEKVKIAQVKLTGYTHAIGNTAENATVSVRNAFYNYEQMYDSLVKVQMPITDGDFDIYSKTVASKKLTVRLSFPNAVKFNEKIYQDMLITVSGGDLAEVIKINLDSSSDVVNGTAYMVILENKLTKDIAYTVTVSGAGYRTARYTVTMNEDKTLNFWNNVKDNAEAVEIASAGNKGYNTVTFLAGDIVKDNIINIYDLSAVVSYFGEEGLSKDNNPGYAKYDLNRDGTIDSKDVAYVLVSWGK